MNYSDSKLSDDDTNQLSIFDLFYVIQKKYLSIVILAIIFFCVFYFIGKILLPSTYSGSLFVMKASDNTRYNKYLQPNYNLSDLVETGTGFVKSTWIANYYGSVLTEWNETLNNENLFLQYSSLLKSKKPMLDYFNNNKGLMPDSSIEEIESPKDLLQSFLVEDSRKFEPEKSILISFRNNNIGEIEKTIYKILEDNQNNVFELVENKLSKILDNAERILESKRSEVKNNLDLFKQNYRLKVEQEINYLKEQAEIARSLGIEKGVLNNVVSQQVTPDSVEIAVGSNVPYYYFGYKAIEKEIEVKSNELNNYSNIILNEEYAIYTDLVKNLNNVSITNYLQEKLRELSLNYGEYNEEFVAAEYIKENIVIEKIGYDQKLLNVIYFILSIGLSILFVFISDLYIRFLVQKKK